MIRVLIGASSPVVRAGLESLLRPYAQFELVDNRSSDSSFDSSVDSSSGLLADAPPDVVLAEIEPSESAHQVLESFENAAGENSIPSVLLVRDPPASMNGALRQGARAVLPANATAAQIAAAIEAVAAGLFVFDPADIEQLLPSRALNRPSARLVEPMTPREIEVLRAMAEGLANKEIAARLGISENTVKFHVGSVMGKLGAASRTEAVTLGIRHGLVLL